jgi:hypothetical protein
MNEVILFNNDLKSQFHIQQHQKALIFLANRVYAYQKIFLEQIGDYLLLNFIILFNEVNRCIEFLLEFIEQYFEQYFDKETIVTENQYRFIKNQIKNALIIIDQSEIHPNSRNVYNLISRVLESESEFELCKFTYSHYRYIKYFLLQIIEIPERLELCLISLNFNDPQFYKYYSCLIVSELQMVSSYQERINLFKAHLKVVNQIKLEKELIYRKDCPSINHWICDWIKEEILFHEKGNAPMLVMPENVSGELGQFKYSLNLSVGQLGLLARLIMEFCFIERPVYKKVAKDLSKNFCTKKAGKSEDLSTESIFGKFYKHDSASKEIMIEILLRMVKRVKEL